MNAQRINQHLQSLADADTAQQTRRFFKTAEGEYSHGDIFLGIRVPVLRKTVNQFFDTPLNEVELLLQSPLHEIRHFALLLLVKQFQKAEPEKQFVIYQRYLANTENINNWDLVDNSAHHIVGAYLFEKDRSPLYQLAQSSSLWERRIAIVSSFYFIKRHQLDDTFKLSKLLLQDQHDLIHKAVGWMLREAGKINNELLKQFIIENYNEMPRTTLRYAIERFNQQQRQHLLKGEWVTSVR